jgi:BirA family biotin operon repressor/biotin-[acetyl-CoA-carboxylase] ligase
MARELNFTVGDPFGAVSSIIRLCHMETPALDVTELRTELRGVVAGIEVVERTGSTNADLMAAARAGAPDRTVLVAEHQDAGRGRLDRRWTSPPRAGLTFSVLLRPASVPPSRWGWLPLLAGLSLARTVREVGADAVLKWPNDLLVGPARAKCAGLLAEAASGPDPAVVLGIGLNVRTTRDELPEGVLATSLLAEGVDVDRGVLLVALLRRLFADEAAWRRAGGDPAAGGLLDGYRAACATLGSRVRIEQPGGRQAECTALDVDTDGRLVVQDPGAPAGATRTVAAGDVVHLRPGGPALP